MQCVEKLRSSIFIKFCNGRRTITRTCKHSSLNYENLSYNQQVVKLTSEMKDAKGKKITSMFVA